MRLIFAKKPVRKRRWIVAAAMVAGLAGLYWHITHNAHDLGTRPAIQHNGPPWMYGPADARFTVIEYADLECPFCKAHFSVMHQWIDQTAARSATHSAGPSINWQWHHLPLAGHEPAASQSALVAECAGHVRGNDAFWKTAEWLYQHSRGNGQGVPAETPVPEADSLRTCLQDKAMAQRLEQQVAQAHQLGITGTPTLVVKDNRTGKAMPIAGPASGDVLLSAIDLLAGDATGSPPAP
jgi:protein-disulfide isomerase